MKKRMAACLLTLALLLALLPAGVAAADENPIIVDSGTYGEISDDSPMGDNVTWTLDNTGLLTLRGTGKTRKSFGVTSWMQTVKRVVIEEGITGLGEYIFAFCPELTSVSLPASLTDIAFSNAFRLSPKLASVQVAAENTAFSCDASGVLYDKEQTKLLYFPAGLQGEFTLPSTVTTVDNSLFTDSPGLTAIRVPAENAAFSGDSSGVLYNKDRSTLIFAPPALKGSYVIPESVTAIADRAFLGCALTSVKIPGGVTEIGPNTFSGCAALAAVELPSQLTAIKENAFSGCAALTAVSLPEGLTSISAHAFSDCTGLTSVELPASLQALSSDAFAGCSRLEAYRAAEGSDRFRTDSHGVLLGSYGTRLLRAPALLRGSYTLPDTVTSLENYAFSDCTEPYSVTIPDRITKIGRAFEESRGLTGIGLHDGVTSIGNSAFLGCSSLTSIDIPTGVTSIAQQAFLHCSSLSSVKIPAGVTSIGHSTFSGCSSLTSVELPAGLTTLGANAFRDCSSLTAIAIPAGVASLPSSVFQDCTALTSVKLPAGLTEIGSEAFYGCASLTSIEIPAGLTSLPVSFYTNAFSGCSKLTAFRVAEGNPAFCTDSQGVLFSKDMTRLVLAPGGLSGSYRIPESVTELSMSAFLNCSKLTSVTVPEGITALASCAFMGCSALTEVKLPNSLVSIGHSAFRDCTSLTSIDLPEGLLSLSYYTFAGCRRLASVSLPAQIQSVPSCCFEDCSALESIRLPAGVTTLDSWAFAGCTSLTDIFLPDGLVSISSNAFENCSALTCLVLPASVRSVDYKAFYGCTGLEGLYFRGDAPSEFWPNAFLYKNEAAGRDERLPKLTLYYMEGASGWTAPTWNGYPSALWNAENSPRMGACGSSLFWRFDRESGTLTVFGQGEMTRFSYNDTPWKPFLDEIRTVVVEPGASGIGNCAFQNMRAMTILTLPDTVLRIGGWAFFGCSALTSLELPEKLTTIGENAFTGCGSLTSIWIPASVVSMDITAFEDCAKLEKIQVDPNNPAYSNDSRGVLFNKDGSSLLRAPGAISGRYDIPAGVVRIGGRSFMFCPSLTGVSIPESAASIGMYAFAHCPSLADVAFPEENLKFIDSYAFIYCTSLTAVTLPDSVTALSTGAFACCTALTSVRLPAGLTEIPFDTFDGCLSLTEITVPAAVTSIKQAAFYKCTALRAVYFLGDAPTLGEAAFQTPDESGTDVNIPGLTLYYEEGRSGWTTPTWNGYPTVPRQEEHVHDYSIVTVTPPTCTEPGCTTHACACGESYRDSETAALGHDFHWIVDREPTPDRDGVKHEACSRCSAVRNEETPIPTGDAPQPDNPFADVKESEYYYTPVLWAVARGITAGTDQTHFSPGATCTRAQVVAFLWRAAGCPEPASSANPFADVKSGAYYARAVLWAVENNVVYGTDSTHFSPNAPCTRAQVVTFLWRFQQKPTGSGINPFQDLTPGAYYAPAVLWAAESGVVYGTSATRFSPDANCTRAQVVSFLHRLLK